MDNDKKNNLNEITYLLNKINLLINNNKLLQEQILDVKKINELVKGQNEILKKKLYYYINQI